MISDGRAEYDTEKRKAIYKELGAAIIDQHWHTPMLYSISFLGLAKNVKGTEQVFSGDAKWRYRELWLS